MKQLATLTICLLLILFVAELSSAQKPELVVQTWHDGWVGSVAFSPDGRTLASGSGDNKIKLWDVATGTLLRTLTGHNSWVFSVAFSPDGKTLASSSSRENTIKLWTVATGTVLRTLTGHSNYVNSVAFSTAGRTLASGSRDNTIKLWDVTTGAEVRTLTGHNSWVFSVSFSPDGKTLASGSFDSIVKLWDVTTGTELRTLTGHRGAVPSVAFSPDGRTLASGSGDNKIKLWDVATGALLRTLTGHSDSVRSVAFSPDGRTLVSGSGDNKVKLWDVASGIELRTLTGHSEWVNSVAFSPDGKTLASGSDSIKLWDVTTSTVLRLLTGYSDSVRSVAFSPDGRTLVSGGGVNKIKLWDVATGTEPRTLTGQALSPDGKTVVISSDDYTIKVRGVTSGAEVRTLTGHNGGVRSRAFSPDGKTLVSGGEDHTIKLWDVATGTLLRTLTGHGNSVVSVAFSPDGKTLASGSFDTRIKLWDVTTGTVLRTLSGDHGYVDLVAFSPDGRTLASGHDDHTIRLWDVTTGTELRTLTGHSDSYRSVAFSPDGKTLAASGTEDHAIKLWDVGTGALLRTLTGHSDSVVSVAFTPDGRTLASGSDDTIKLWDTKNGQELASLIGLDRSDWVVATPDGLFDGSPAAWNKMIWRAQQNTRDFVPVEAYFNDFYYPGLLTDIFAGKRPTASSDIALKDRRQPQLKLTSVDTRPVTTFAHRNAALRIDIPEALAGAQDVRLFRNGSLVKVWRGDVLKGQRSVTLETSIPIIAGANNFIAYAFNHDNIKSSDATLTVTGADSPKRSGTAYILAVGINRYSNSRYNLKYAVADADDFSAELKRQQELLKRYEQVEVVSLSNAQATKANITQKLAELATRVQPEDAVIVFFAGHGTAQGNQFYLIPHDLGYRGRRDTLSEAGLQTILAHSISDRELEKLFEGIDASQLLLVIDACNSGQALEAEEKRRGPMNSKGLAQLAYEKGMYVLTAAQSFQAAQEAAKLGHGFLTYALVEDGLKQGKADREPKDRTIDLREWLNYATEEVPKMQEENMLDALRGRSRYLNFVGDGSGPKDTKSNVQRPRIFYRRELDSNPLIIAVLGANAPR